MTKRIYLPKKKVKGKNSKKKCCRGGVKLSRYSAKSALDEMTRINGQATTN